MAEWFSPFIWFLVVCFISLYGNYELEEMIEGKNYRQNYKLLNFLILLFLSVTYVSANVQITQENFIDNLKLILSPQNQNILTFDWKSIFANQITSLQNLVLGISFLLLIIVKLNYKPRLSISELSFGLIRLIYLGFFPSYIILLRALPNGAEILLGLLVSGAMSDTFAYFSGKKFGKTPFVQEISPNKTLEGAIGGALACVTFLMILNSFLAKLPWYHALIIGILVAIVAPMGDLVESFFKRDLGVKDSGSIIPGHGGILDRVDSYVFTSFPVYFYVLYWVY